MALSLATLRDPLDWKARRACDCKARQLRSHCPSRGVVNASLRSSPASDCSTSRSTAARDRSDSYEIASTRPDPRCRHRCTAAGHQYPRSPGSARRSRSWQGKAAHHRGPRLRARSVAAPDVPTAEAPRMRPATRPGWALCASVPRRQPRAPRCEHDKPPRPPLARRSRRP